MVKPHPWLAAAIALLALGCGSSFTAADPPPDASDAPTTDDAGSASDVASEPPPSVTDAASGGGPERDAPALPEAQSCPGPVPARCGCQAAPQCHGDGCTWQVGPVYCANGMPECVLVPSDGSCTSQ